MIGWARIGEDVDFFRDFIFNYNFLLIKNIYLIKKFYLISLISKIIFPLNTEIDYLTSMDEIRYG